MNNTELIEKYLNGDLNDKETSEFNVRLEVDKNFKKDFDLYKEVDDSIIDTAPEFRIQMDKIHHENNMSGFKKFINKYFSFKKQING